MIYVKNETNQQRIYIPRNDGSNSQDIHLQRKDFNITENGDYPIAPDSGYQGISGGTISVEVVGPGYDEGYQAGYSSGYTEGETAGQQEGYSSGYTEGEQAGYSSGYTEGETAGEATQKAKLASFTATTNGHYTREDGWNEVEVLVPQTTGGTAVLVPLTADTNTTYYPAEYQADGFNQVEVSVDTQPAYDEGYQQGYSDGEVAGEAAGEQIGYANGYADGEEAQKALLSEFTASTNGVYTSDTGYSAVTVNVQGGGGSVLTAETFTNNGTYTPGTGIDGWNNITIAVPTSAGTNIPITAVTEQYYQANSSGTYNFTITTADTLNRLVVYFPQTGGTQITAWYQDDYGYDTPTQLFYTDGYPYMSINSISIDDGPAIAPVDTYLFGDSGQHKVVFDLKYRDTLVSFANCTALTSLDCSESYSIYTPYCSGCIKLSNVNAKRAESTRGMSFAGCTSLYINVAETFPLLSTITSGAFERSSVYSLGEIQAETIEEFAFSGCTLNECNLKGVRSVGNWAFEYTVFTDVFLPYVQNYSIGKHCFYYNTNLQTIRMETPLYGTNGNGTIHYGAFANCSGLTTWSVSGEIPVPTIVDDNRDQTSTPFERIPSSGTLDLNGAGRYIQAWRTFAATYLPGWTVQETN